jgi:hypothetical protein
MDIKQRFPIFNSQLSNHTNSRKNMTMIDDIMPKGASRHILNGSEDDSIRSISIKTPVNNNNADDMDV